MVALQHPYVEVPAEHPEVAAARCQLDRLQTGLPRALLAAPPEAVRALAERARRAEAVVARRLALVGERPALDDGAEAEAIRAAAAYHDACAARSEARSRGHVLLARGNAVALGCLGLAGGLHLSGMHPMAAPVAAVVLGAASAPLTAVALVLRGQAKNTAAVTSARQRWAAALEAAGVPTMGALAARRLAVSGWERRQREASVAVQVAARHRRAWQRLAGPGAEPEEIDSLLERLVALRRAQLALLAALVEDRVRSIASPSVALVAESAPEAVARPEPTREPAPARHGPEPEPVHLPDDREVVSWLEEAIERVRGHKLHLWLWR